MKKQILYSTKKNVDIIIHLSDIHIRLFQRHVEYKSVFEKTYEKIRSFQKKDLNVIIVVTGDIVHSKNELSPECETMTFDFLFNLSQIFSTIVIAGNHDALLTNHQRMDTIYSILYKRKPENLYYLRDSGLYEYENIIFHIDSLLDDIKMNMTDTITLERDKINIALYHGSIRGWKNTKGYKSDHGEKYIEEFSGMDYVLLGDIHMHQYMSRTKPISAYASSLISQNFGETDENHGFLVWDLNKKIQNYIKIPNPYRYQDVYLIKNDIFETDGNRYTFETLPISPKGQIKVFGMDDDIQSRVLFENLKTCWKDATFYYQPKQKRFIESNKKDEAKVDSEEKIIKDFIIQNSKESDFEELYQFIMKEYYKTEQITNGKVEWKIVRLQFSNLFGYGPDNEIKFSSDLNNNVIGIFGENSYGKSTLIDIITLLMFDKVTRFSHGNSIPNEVIHFGEKQATGIIEIVIGSDLYRIQKKYTRGDKIKTLSKFYRINDKKQIELTGEQRKKTKQSIENVFGNFEKFIYTHSFLQQREVSFREMTSSVKKKFLNDLYGLDRFEIMEKSCKEKCKELETTMKVFHQELKKKSSLSYQNESSKIDKEYQLLDEQLSNVISKKENQYKEQETLLSKLQLGYNYSTFDFDYNCFLDKKNTLEKCIQEKENKKKEYQSFINEWKDSFFIKNWEKYNTNPLFHQWHPKQSTKKKWDSFIEQQTDGNVKELLKQLYKKQNNTKIIVDSKILSLFSLNEKDKIKEALLDENEILQNLKKYYNELNFSFEKLQENTMFHEKKKQNEIDTKNDKEKLKGLEAIVQSYSKYSDFINSNESKDFIKLHEMYTSNPLYQKHSPFFPNSTYMTNYMEYDIDSISSIRENIKINNEKIDQLQKNIPSYNEKNLCSKKEYLNYKEQLHQEPYNCSCCEYKITDTFETDFATLSENSLIQFNLKNDISMINDNLKECHFEPNLNCSVCLENKEYKYKLLWENKLEMKQKELSIKQQEETKIYNKIHKTMKQTKKDIHIKKYLSEKPSIENLSLFKKEKEQCQQKMLKEQQLYNYYQEKVSNYDNYHKYQQNISKRNEWEDKNTELQKKLDHILFCIENEKMFQYIKCQWKFVLPNSIKEIKEILSIDRETIELKISELKDCLLSRETEWEQFQSCWKKDRVIYEKIFSLEKELELQKKYKIWLQEFEKYTELNEQIRIENEIKHLELQSVWIDERDLFLFLTEIWKKKKLWDKDGNEIIKKLKEMEKDIQIMERDIIIENEKYNTIINQMTTLQEKWKQDLQISQKIKELKLKEQQYENDIKELNSKKMEYKLYQKQLETDFKHWEETKRELYKVESDWNREKQILRLIDKDGLPLFLLKTKMKQMEEHMNELIQHFLNDKQIRFELDDKNIVFGTTTKKDTSTTCHYFGGMESFIIDLALKLTFAKYGILPRSNFFIIDEGISVLDQKRQHNIRHLFDFLSTITNNVLLISHIPQIKDFVHKSIQIEKVNGKSNVRFLIEN